MQFEAWLFLGAVTLVVLYRVTCGHIDIGDAQINRAQLLVAVVVLAGYYLSQVDPTTPKLPDLTGGPTNAFGGSVFIYLANKLWSRWSDLTHAT